MTRRRALIASPYTMRPPPVAGCLLVAVRVRPSIQFKLTCRLKLTHRCLSYRDSSVGELMTEALALPELLILLKIAGFDCLIERTRMQEGRLLWIPSAPSLPLSP